MAAMTRRAPLLFASLLVAVGLTVGMAATASPVSAGGLVVEQIEITEAGPLGPVTVIGDSVLVGASYTPSLPVRLAELGWGPIRFRASGGGSTGFHLDDRHEASLRNWVRWWRERGWDAPTVIVNLGANDAGICSGNTARCAAAIRHLMDQIGPEPTVVWGKITHLYAGHANAWNTALAQVAAQRTNLVLWDWPAAQTAHGIALSGDRIHLAGRAPYQRRSVVMAHEITDLVAVARPQSGMQVSLPRGTAAPSTYVAVTPQRLLDTRTGMWPVPAGRRVRIPLSGSVPPGTTAVAVGVTATATQGDGYVTVWSCDGAAPDSSVLNTTTGRDRSAQAVVAAQSTLCVRSSTPTHVLVDLQGAFTTGTSGARLRPSTPRRVVDTRSTGRAAQVSFPSPTGATAVAVTITATNTRSAGFVSAFPCGGTSGGTSVVNAVAGDTVAGSAYVPVGRNGRVCVTTSGDADLLVDLTGSFHQGTTGLRFVPTTPTRLLDTRLGTGGWRGFHGRNQTLDVVAAPVGAQAVTGTLTQINPSTTGFVTAAPCSTSPDTSNVNTARGGVMAVSVTVALSPQRRLCVTASTPGHTVFDLTGWWRR